MYSDIDALIELAKQHKLELVGAKIHDGEYRVDGNGNIIFLSLDNLEISDISSLKNLSKIRELYLSSNEISDISVLKELTNLTKLDLSCNKIKKLPQEIIHLPMGIKLETDLISKGMYLGDNPIVTPPLEIIRKGRRTVLWIF